jgi:hypothetical protein
MFRHHPHPHDAVATDGLGKPTAANVLARLGLSREDSD